MKQQKLKNNSKLPVSWERVEYIEIKIRKGKWKIFAGVYSAGG